MIGPSPDAPRFTIDAAELGPMIEVARRVPVNDPVLPELRCLNFRADEERVTVLAASPLRMAVSQHLRRREFAAPIDVLVPADNFLREFDRLRAEGAPELAIAVQGDEVFLGGMGRWVALPRRDSKNFPDYTALLPRRFEQEAEVDRRALLEAVQQATVSGREASIRLRVGKGCIEAGTLPVGAETDGPRVDVHVAIGHALDALECLPGSTVGVRLASPLRPVLFSSADGLLHHLVMPRRG